MSERRAEQLGSVPPPGQGMDAGAGNERPPWPPRGDASDGARTDQDPEGAGSRRRIRERERGANRSGAWSWVRETAIILVSALVLSLVVKTFLVQAFFIPSQSMHDTLIENDRILVSKLTPGPRDLRRGDVVVFKDPGGWLPPVEEPARGPVGTAVEDALTWIGLLPQDAGEHLVKRVIGLPGDRVASAGPGSPVTVNGVPIDEPYLAAGVQPSEKTFDVVVPENSVWVMGDNRPRSADSRFNQGRPGGGSVPMDNIVGVAFVTVWPLDRVTVLRNPSDTFAGVPDPS
ncbi:MULTISPECIES: signal peptidase I [Cellulomonas]|uniref:signal peptidase I n=1 Tax=Cellulomonas TaxID=1707 RepID=UPI001FE56C7D|nr:MULTISPECIES: signal peptidase I [Cellulomonas]